MVVVMQERANDEQIQRVIAQLVEMGFDVHRSTGALRTVIGAVGGNRQFDPRLLEVLDGVQEVLRITEPYKLASRTFRPENTVIAIGDLRIGGDEVIVMAGPCSAETEEQVEASAAAVKRAGAKVLGGGRSPQSGARDRDHGRQPAPCRREVRTHPAGWRAQHAELLAAPRAREGA